MGVLDTVWTKNRDSLLILHKKLENAINEVEGLPLDLDHPESQNEVERVDAYVQHLDNVNSEIFECIENLMLKEKVQKAWDEIENESLPDEGNPGFTVGE